METHLLDIVAGHVSYPPLLRATRHQQPIVILDIDIQDLILFDGKFCRFCGIVVV